MRPYGHRAARRSVSDSRGRSASRSTRGTRRTFRRRGGFEPGGFAGSRRVRRPPPRLDPVDPGRASDATDDPRRPDPGGSRRPKMRAYTRLAPPGPTPAAFRRWRRGRPGRRVYELLCMNADASNTTSQGRASEDVEAGGAPVAVDPGARARTPSRPGFADPPGFDGPGARRRPGGLRPDGGRRHRSRARGGVGGVRRRRRRSPSSAARESPPPPPADGTSLALALRVRAPRSAPRIRRRDRSTPRRRPRCGSTCTPPGSPARRRSRARMRPPGRRRLSPRGVPASPPAARSRLPRLRARRARARAHRLPRSVLPGTFGPVRGRFLDDVRRGLSAAAVPRGGGGERDERIGGHHPADESGHAPNHGSRRRPLEGDVVLVRSGRGLPSGVFRARRLSRVFPRRMRRPRVGTFFFLLRPSVPRAGSATGTPPPVAARPPHVTAGRRVHRRSTAAVHAAAAFRASRLVGRPPRAGSRAAATAARAARILATPETGAPHSWTWHPPPPPPAPTTASAGANTDAFVRRWKKTSSPARAAKTRQGGRRSASSAADRRITSTSRGGERARARGLGRGGGGRAIAIAGGNVGTPRGDGASEADARARRAGSVPVGERRSTERCSGDCAPGRGARARARSSRPRRSAARGRRREGARARDPGTTRTCAGGARRRTREGHPRGEDPAAGGSPRRTPRARPARGSRRARTRIESPREPSSVARRRRPSAPWSTASRADPPRTRPLRPTSSSPSFAPTPRDDVDATRTTRGNRETRRSRGRRPRSVRRRARAPTVSVDRRRTFRSSRRAVRESAARNR